MAFAGTLPHFTFHLTSLQNHALLQIHHLSICTQAGLPMDSLWTHTGLPLHSAKGCLSEYKNECLTHETEEEARPTAAQEKWEGSHTRATTAAKTQESEANPQFLLALLYVFTEKIVTFALSQVFCACKPYENLAFLWKLSVVCLSCEYNTSW